MAKLEPFPELNQSRMKIFRDLLKDPMSQAWRLADCTVYEMAATLCHLAASASISVTPDCPIVGIDLGLAEFLGQIELQCEAKGISVTFETEGLAQNLERQKVH